MAVKAPEIGKLRQIVRFEKNSPTQLGAGKKDDYDILCTTRGMLRKKRGNRSQSFGEALLESQWELFVRFENTLTNDLGKSVKVVIDNMFFTIDSFELIDQKLRYYYFVLNEER